MIFLPETMSRLVRRCLAIVVCLFSSSISADEAQLDFALHVKGLLSDRCVLCHGPDATTREADLRLDSEADIKGPLQSDASRSAVVPGRPQDSELIRRILSDDPDIKMPPPTSGLSLNADEKHLLQQWVADGAGWQGHWAFEPIVKPPVPDVGNIDWCRNAIDRFIVARQEQNGLAQNEMATKERLIRRATFDLTGLPPSLEHIDAFLADESPGAFEAVIDRLLSSEQFGERMTADWLDVARYSDTYGYQVDRDRFVWPWRDWVIKAFNNNMPYNRFITEQLAGDLLPNATRDQILATTFNRLHPQKVEGGSVPEEFRVEYVADRTQTTATAFLGLTFECARCHDHKYDPMTQKEYYQLYSFFNNIDEAGLYSYFTSSVPTPTLALPTESQEQQLAAARTDVATAEAALAKVQRRLHDEARRDAVMAAFRKQEQPADGKELPGQVAILAFDEGQYSANTLVDSPKGRAVQLTGDHGIDVKVGNFARWQPFTIATWMKSPKAFERSVVFHRSRAWTDAGSRGYELLIEDGRLSAALIHFWPGNAIRIQSVTPLPIDQWVHVTMTYDGSSSAAGLKLWLNGEAFATTVVRDNLTRNITGGGGDTITIGERFRDIGFARGLIDDFRVFERELTPVEIRHTFNGTALTESLAAAEPSPELVQFAAVVADAEYQQQLQNVQTAREALCRLQDSVQEIMVMKDHDTRRTTHVLNRGAYDAPGEEVSAQIPAWLLPMDESVPRNRLGLAQWLTSPQHPLTARVAVNRFWQMCFGHGLVRSPEDFGSQGMPPSHPRLLDWLAADFRDHHWDVKRFLKQILMSATYQQSSRATADQLRIDPENAFLSHAPVFRLSAEMLRDNALAVSGLLQRQIGGPPVHPYELSASFKPSTPDKGPGLYRRSLYTYWKRTAPAPMMMTLDASARDVCRVKRERTASPLQSLVVMNSPQFVEAARALSQRLIDQHGDDDDAIVSDMFRLLTSRRPADSEQSILRNLYTAQRSHFDHHPDAAAEYLGVGATPISTNQPGRLAAFCSVANALLAFDECLMKR
ncbi:MAG: DUF1553 domain-containing protein [Planctomycetaceae bacterium]